MNDELRSEVLRRKYGGQSGRDIARDLHLSRKTVAKVLAEHRQQRANGTTGLPKPRKSRGSLVDAYEATLRDYLARYPDMTRGPAVGRGSCAVAIRAATPFFASGSSSCASSAIGRPWSVLRRGRGSKPKWTGRRTRSTSPRKAAAR